MSSHHRLYYCTQTRPDENDSGSFHKGASTVPGLLVQPERLTGGDCSPVAPTVNVFLWICPVTVFPEALWRDGCVLMVASGSSQQPLSLCSSSTALRWKRGPSDSFLNWLQTWFISRNHQSKSLNAFPFSPNICYQTGKHSTNNGHDCFSCYLLERGEGCTGRQNQTLMAESDRQFLNNQCFHSLICAQLLVQAFMNEF